MGRGQRAAGVYFPRTSGEVLEENHLCVSPVQGRRKTKTKRTKKDIFVLIVSFFSPLVMLLSLLTHTDYLPLGADPFHPTLSFFPPLSFTLSCAGGTDQHLVAGCFSLGLLTRTYAEFPVTMKEIHQGRPVFGVSHLNTLPPIRLRLNFIDSFGMTPPGKFIFTAGEWEGS